MTHRPARGRLRDRIKKEVSEMRGAICLAVAAFLASVTASASAGDFVGGTWQPTRCARPVPPPIDRTDAQSLNLSVAHYNDYVDELQRFLGCLKSEAEADMQTILDGFNAAQGEAQREASLARPPGTAAR